MKPHILVIIDSLRIGGPGKGIFQLLHYADPARAGFTLCNFDYRQPRSTEFIDYARSRGFPIVLLSQRFRFDPSPLWQLYKFMKATDIDIVQTHGYKGHLLVWLLRWALPKVPWIAVEHGWTAENFKVRIYNALDRFLLRKSDVAITVSPALQETVSRLRGTSRKTYLILNAIEPKNSKDTSTHHLRNNEYRGNSCTVRGSIRRRFATQPTDILIGAFGRLSPEKGQDILLEAFVECAQHVQNAHVLLVGEGPERGRLEQLSKQLGIAHLVHFAGYQSNMQGFYEAIDILVIPSRSEGLPNVLLEAMSNDVPALATDVGAVREVISHGNNGWIVPTEDPIALSSTLKDILSNPQELIQKGKAAQSSLYPKFCPTTRAEKFVSLYEKLLCSS